MRTTLLSLLAVALSACAADPAPEPVAPAAAPLDAVATLAEGERLWRASCPLPGAPELCLEAVAPPAAPHCGEATSLLARHPREASGRAAALAAFEAAASAGRTEAPGSPGRAAAARALYLLGDDATEELFAAAFPDGLDFAEAHAEASRARFKGFLHDTTEALRRAKGLYQDAAALGTADALPAALRIAQLYERYGRLVALAGVPADVVPHADALAAYCDALADEAAKLVARADEARAACRDTWTALPEASRPAAGTCDAQLEPRVALAPVHADEPQ